MEGDRTDPIPAQEVNVPLIKESPVNIECRVSEIRELGSHHMFLARVVAVDVDEAYLNERADLNFKKRLRLSIPMENIMVFPVCWEPSVTV